MTPSNNKVDDRLKEALIKISEIDLAGIYSTKDHSIDFLNGWNSCVKAYNKELDRIFNELNIRIV